MSTLPYAYDRSRGHPTGHFLRFAYYKSRRPFPGDDVDPVRDGSGLIWFLVVAENDGGREGPWGKQTGGTERSGPGTNGASNVCAATNKDTASTCGD